MDAEAQQQMMGSRASSQWRPTNAAVAPPNGVSSAALAPPGAGAPRQPAPPPKVNRVAGENSSAFNAGRIHTYKFDQGLERDSGAAGNGEQKASPRSDVWSHRVPLSHKYRNVVNLKPVNFGVTATADGAPPSGSQTERTERKGDRDMKMPPADAKGALTRLQPLTARGPPPKGAGGVAAEPPPSGAAAGGSAVFKPTPPQLAAPGGGSGGGPAAAAAGALSERMAAPGARQDSSAAGADAVVRNGSSVPMTPAEAIRMQGHTLSNHETGEILAYPKARARACARLKRARRASIKALTARRRGRFFSWAMPSTRSRPICSRTTAATTTSAATIAW